MPLSASSCCDEEFNQEEKQHEEPSEISMQLKQVNEKRKRLTFSTLGTVVNYFVTTYSIKSNFQTRNTEDKHDKDVFMNKF